MTEKQRTPFNAELEESIFNTFNLSCKALAAALKEDAEVKGRLAEIAVEKHRLAVFIKYYSESRGFAVDEDMKSVLASTREVKTKL